eukprot:CAMPEP_0196821940 /NCGR_PEP_ID=MMETSP1362-20130617/81584_1 /TAXON_ID=163516 /ORGANISM="Leptocylindrus danicus, Strain CCMP1856" /LENGTH=256 /DNA_ID=CAMNT_0042201333 /DNA_START=680 /DNA_END=1450 /DNA_ORIENTATION=-
MTLVLPSPSPSPSLVVVDGMSSPSMSPLIEEGPPTADAIDGSINHPTIALSQVPSSELSPVHLSSNHPSPGSVKKNQDDDISSLAPTALELNDTEHPSMNHLPSQVPSQTIMIGVADIISSEKLNSTRIRGLPQFSWFVLFMIVAAIVSCAICCLALVGCGIIDCILNCNDYERKFDRTLSDDSSAYAMGLNAWPLPTESNAQRSVFTAISQSFLPRFSPVADDRSRCDSIYEVDDEDDLSSRGQKSSVCCGQMIA